MLTEGVPHHRWRQDILQLKLNYLRVMLLGICWRHSLVEAPLALLDAGVEGVIVQLVPRSVQVNVEEADSGNLEMCLM